MHIGSVVSWTKLKKILQFSVALIILLFSLQGVMGADPIPLKDQPYPDALSYADGAIQIANGKGFTLSFSERLPLEQQLQVSSDAYPSRYPPGFSLLLTSSMLIGEPDLADAQRMSKVLSLLLMILVFIVAWLLNGPIAAGIAVLISAWSPFISKSAQLVMSDALGAILSLLALLLILLFMRTSSQSRWNLSCLIGLGAVAGYSLITRTSLLTILLALVIVFRSIRSLKFLLLGLMPFLIFLGTYQWTQFGHPLSTGYDYYLPELKEFSLSYATEEYPLSERQFIYADKLDGQLMTWTCPCDEFGPIGKASNIVFYPAVLLGAYWFYFPPAFSIASLIYFYQRRKNKDVQFAAIAIVLTLLLFIPYFYQGARLMSPAAFLLLVYGAAAIASLLKRLISWGNLRFIVMQSGTRSPHSISIE